jgi:hypothetical protein
MGDCTPITSECGTDWWFDNAPKLSRERLVTSTKTHYYSMGLPAAVCNSKCLQYKTFHQTGNFAKTGHPPYFSGLIGTQIQWLATEFPAQRNREFPNAYQGIFFKEQRI